MKKAIFPAVLMAFLGACAGPETTDFDRAKKLEAYMTSWTGHYQSELVGQWGPPTHIAPDGEGGTILTYESLKGLWGEEKDKQIEGGLHYPTGPRQMGYKAKRIFFVNERGIIYKSTWSGL